jgi:outer membrane murein-binding lipoprotein Lpp
MEHLTDEQLARVALGLAEGEPLAGHVAGCAACQARLDKVSRLTDQLAAAHAEVDQTHTASRERLLAAIQQEPQPNRRAETAFRLASLLGGLNMRQRIALGGVGLSTAAVIVLTLVFANPVRELSAMERIVKAVREVTSCSFTWSNRITFAPREGKPRVIRVQTCNVYWRAPSPGNEQWLGDLAAPIKCVQLDPDAAGLRKPRLRTDITEVYPTGKPGILINFLDKYYFWTPPLPASELPRVSPMAMLTAVRDGSCEVIRELGTRQIEGREARGYILNVKGAPAFPKAKGNEVEVWVDPATDLPIQFRFEEDNGGDPIAVFRITDCRWNIKLDDSLFKTMPPDGFVNSTWPTKRAKIDEIVSALRLYAELSGGKYPKLLKFDRDAVRRQMLENAGFNGPPQADWAKKKKFQQIEGAMPGLQQLADVLVDIWHTGYYADKVTAQDKDNVLFWWPDSVDRKYVVFYGDLRSEVIPGPKLVELEPSTEGLVVYGVD